MKGYTSLPEFPDMERVPDFLTLNKAGDFRFDVCSRSAFVLEFLQIGGAELSGLCLAAQISIDGNKYGRVLFSPSRASLGDQRLMIVANAILRVEFFSGRFDHLYAVGGRYRNVGVE